MDLRAQAVAGQVPLIGLGAIGGVRPHATAPVFAFETRRGSCSGERLAEGPDRIRVRLRVSQFKTEEAGVQLIGSLRPEQMQIAYGRQDLWEVRGDRGRDSTHVSQTEFGEFSYVPSKPTTSSSRWFSELTDCSKAGFVVCFRVKCETIMILGPG